MPQNSLPPTQSLIPPEPISAGAQAFSRQVRSFLDGQPKDEAAVTRAFEGMEDMFDQIAAGLYSLASMLVGEGEDSARLVETAVSTTEVSACHDPVQARQSSRRTLSTLALDLLATRDPACLAAPRGITHSDTCIEDDDLSAAGVSSQELESMIAGPDRDRVRKWLSSLPIALRTIFILRAVAGFTTGQTAALLADHGGPQAAGWNPSAVSEFFRQGLCSLASQLIHANTAR